MRFLFFLACLSLLVAAQSAVDGRVAFQRRDVLAHPEVPDPLLLETFSFGFESVLSDLLWLQAVQYVGGSGLSRNLPSLGPLLETITDLDPRFEFPYLFGQLLLPEFGQANEAVRLGEKGVYAVSTSFDIPFQTSWNYFWYLRQDAPALALMQMAQRRAPREKRELVLKLQALYLTHANVFETAALLYEERIKEVADPLSKESLLSHLQRVRNLQVLAAAVKNYVRERGACAPDLGALIAGGYLSLLPQDPFGKKYGLNPGTCRLTVEF